MNRILKNFGCSFLRITTALAVITGAPCLLYWCWQPGNYSAKLSSRENAAWLGHGWLGDDGWFRKYRKNPDGFRDGEKIRSTLDNLRKHRIRTVYPHLCPAEFNGAVAPYDSPQVERFLDAAEETEIAVIPWIGGILGESARPGEIAWRGNFVASVKTLLEKHPRLAGVQLNIEPLPSGNADFLTLLDELRPVLAGKTLSVAAYPPPTKWHPVPGVHWEKAYLTQVAKRSDQLAVMMYDTSIKLEKFYIHLMKQWTRDLVAAVGPTDCKLLLGVPAYEDAETRYHHPRVENLTSALAGILAANPQAPVTGIAIYSEWEMTPEKWQIWRDRLE